MDRLLETAISTEQFLNISVLIFLFGLFGIFVLRRNLIMIIISLELLLLAVNLLFIIFSIYLDDMIGQLFSIFILTIAGAESSIGLALLVVYHRITGSIRLVELRHLRG
jgi:NADH-quinone oxidoreductase subunit K